MPPKSKLGTIPRPKQLPPRPKPKTKSTTLSPSPSRNTSPTPRSVQSALPSQSRSRPTSPSSTIRPQRPLPSPQEVDPLLSGKRPPKPEELLKLYRPTTNYPATNIIRSNSLMKGTSTNLGIHIFQDTTPLTWISFFVMFTVSMIIMVISIYVVALELTNLFNERGKLESEEIGYIFMNWINSNSFVSFSICLSLSLVGWALAV